MHPGRTTVCRPVPWRGHRSALLRLMLLAALFAALAPSVSRLLVAAAGIDRLEVCSAAVPGRLPPQDPAGAGAAAQHAGDHCPFCRLQDLLPVLPALQPGGPWPPAHAGPARLGPDAAVRAAAPQRLAHLSRAPPAL